MRDERLLAVEGLCAWYGGAQILFDVALSVGRGEVVALMGRNGAGKSMTMKAIMGLVGRRRGTVRFADRDISHLEPYRIARLGLGFTPEDRRVFTDLTVLENLDIGRQPPRRFADGAPAPTWTPERRFALFPNLAERRLRTKQCAEQCRRHCDCVKAWFVYWQRRLPLHCAHAK